MAAKEPQLESLAQPRDSAAFRSLKACKQPSPLCLRKASLQTSQSLVWPGQVGTVVSLCQERVSLGNVLRLETWPISWPTFSTITRSARDMPPVEAGEMESSAPLCLSSQSRQPVPDQAEMLHGPGAPVSDACPCCSAVDQSGTAKQHLVDCYPRRRTGTVHHFAQQLSQGPGALATWIRLRDR